MDIITSCKKAFPDVNIPDIKRYYSEHINLWRDIFENNPPWRKVKRSGLYNKGFRRLKRLNTAKCLCDELSALTFSEQCNIALSDEKYQNYINKILEHNCFWDSLPEFITYAYALGGGCLKVYASNNKPCIDYIHADKFVPVEWTGKRITGGIFQSTICSNEYIYTICEKYGQTENCNKLFKSTSVEDIGYECEFSELFKQPIANYNSDVKMFGYFKPCVANNAEYETPLGMSVYANAIDTLEALDIAFDSFSREFVLGKKRIIVPASAIQTVVDTESGKLVRYFDADDEVFTALSTEDGETQKIVDNTVVLRIEEHVAAINALLNILCFQVGLSAGTLSFDAVQGIKTATEVISQDSKTARTIKCNKNLLTETIEDVVHAVISLGVLLGDIPKADYKLTIGWQDNIIIDDNVLIDNNIKLVQAGLKSKLSAVMDVLKCDEETAQKELERISKEQSVSGLAVDDFLNGGEDSDETGDDAAQQGSE